MASTGISFTEEDMAIDEGLGYPKAYAKLCRNPHVYSQGPPFAFIPYILHNQEALRARDLNQIFPIIDTEGKASANPEDFVNLLWKQLNHLGNAGFDPAKFRVDPYGNVLYFHADYASPLSWEIDHWFPCSRGGKTVPSNLMILQWQVCKKKKNKLEFLVPWWDLQLGISVNQFLSVFASKNSDFRRRGFSFLFSEGENEELNALQAVESHTFPKHFIETKRKVGLAPAAIVSPRGDSDVSALKSLDFNRPTRPGWPAIGLSATQKFSSKDDEALSKASQRIKAGSILKENENSETGNYQYLALSIARDSLKRKDETDNMQAEMRKLDDELNKLNQKNETERLALQELETTLIKRRRRVEKSRRLAEAQSSYKALLEKMIRDAMHQSVVYKEQLRLNQAATSALMARLEAQKAICDSSETELHRRYKHRDEIEKQIRPYWEQARKRSRIEDTLLEERPHETAQLLLGARTWKPLKKELRLFLEEEQMTSEAGEEREQEEAAMMEEANVERPKKDNSLIVMEDETFCLNNKLEKLAMMEKAGKEREQEEAAMREGANVERAKKDKSLIVMEDKTFCLNNKLEQLAIQEGECSKTNEQMSPVPQTLQNEDEEEYRKNVGKGNVDKWLQMLLENTEEGSPEGSPPQSTVVQDTNRTDEIVRKLNLKNPQKDVKIFRLQTSEENVGLIQTASEERVNVGCKDFTTGFDSSEVGSICNGVEGCKSFEGKERGERKIRKERGLVRCESARAFRPIPSSPSVILGMRRGVDCMGKKPMVIGDDEEVGGNENHVMKGKFIKTCTQAIKKAVK